MTDAQKVLSDLLDYLDSSASMRLTMKHEDGFSPPQAVKTIRTALENAAKVDGLVSALKKIAYQPIGGKTADFLCSARLQGVAREVLSQFESEKKGGA